MLPAEQLTKLERMALQRAIAKVNVVVWHDALIKQVDGLHVKNRTKRTMGYYVDFEVPPALRISDLTDDFNQNPPQTEAVHPDGENALFFIVYVKDGSLSFMEAASTSDWPEDEEQIAFLEINPSYPPIGG